MNNWGDLLLHSDFGSASASFEVVLFAMLLSFTIGHTVAWVYMWTHDALSYSRTFVTSLAVIPVIVALMMILMSSGLVVAFGLLAVFAVVRFRNVLKDTRDTTFILWVIVEGLAVGTMRYSSALVGLVFIALVLFYFRLTSFGSRNRYDAVLSLQLTGDLATALAELKGVLQRYTTKSLLTSERRLTDEGLDLSYRVQLRDPRRSEELQWALRQAAGIEHVSFYLHEGESEV